MFIPKNFLFGSLVVHLIILCTLSVITFNSESLKKTFVVFGAHTSKPTSVRYKSTKGIIPFAMPPKLQSRAKNLKTSNSADQKISKSSHKKPDQKKAIPSSTKNVKSISPQKTPTQATKKINAPAVKNSTKKQIQELAEKKPILKKALAPKEEKNDSTPTPVEAQPEQSTDLNQAPTELDASLFTDTSSQQVLVYKKEIQQEVDRVWRPPVGVDKGTVCSIQFSISSQGIVECSYEQRSSVLIYDLSALRAAREMKFSKAFWGKQFRIAFHQ